MIERNCSLARRFAERLDGVAGATVLNDVVLNQVLVRFGDDETHRPGHRAHVQDVRGVLDGCDDMARPARHAHLGLELAHHAKPTWTDRSTPSSAAASRLASA